MPLCYFYYNIPNKIDFATTSGTPSLSSGWSHGSGDPLTVERWGKFIFISGRANYSDNIPSFETEVGTLPEGFRPSKELFEPVMGGSGALSRVIIRPNGKFSANILSGYTTNYLKFNILYLSE